MVRRVRARDDDASETGASGAGRPASMLDAASCGGMVVGSDMELLDLAMAPCWRALL